MIKTVNSLSGGKTSSYLAVHFPADAEIFALCCIDDHNAGKGIDPAIKRAATEKLAKTCPQYGEFRATSENPIILRTMLDLEQMIGREIVWVRGESWETMIRRKKYLPNQQVRFCTSVLKIEPIFHYLFLHGMLPCRMRIGFRFDEQDRVETMDLGPFKYATHCEQMKNGQWRHRWAEMDWREVEFPLIEAGVFSGDVRKFWADKPVPFAKDSNCQFCFWKHPQILAKNFQEAAGIMKWAGVQEVCAGAKFKKEGDLFAFSRLGIQADFGFEDTDAGCKAGFCMG